MNSVFKPKEKNYKVLKIKSLFYQYHNRMSKYYQSECYHIKKLDVKVRTNFIKIVIQNISCIFNNKKEYCQSFGRTHI